MALQLQTVIQSIRLADPRFGRDVVPDRVLGDALGIVQQRLARLATQRNHSYLAQTFSIGFNLANANLPGNVYAGSDSGLPGTVTNGTASVVEQSVGNALTLDTADATIIVDAFVAGAVTATTLQQVGAARTVNGDVGYYLLIQDGPGSGPYGLRKVVSNTADTWTVDNAWTTNPVPGESICVLIAAPAAQATAGVVTGLPALTAQASYLVKLDAGGVPYLDTTSPVVTHVEAGIPLPSFDKVLGGNVYLSPVVAPFNITGPYQRPLFLTTYDMRHRAVAWPAAYVQGTTLYLLGTQTTWLGVDSVELRYVPIPPMFPTDGTARTSYFLLPDTAFDALVAHGKVRAAEYARAQQIDIDPAQWRADAAQVEAAWLMTVGRQQQGAMRGARRNR